ncbi:uncharacterized [Tachysurus ichikawai]
MDGGCNFPPCFTHASEAPPSNTDVTREDRAMLETHTETQSWCKEGRCGVWSERGKCLSCPRKVLHAYSCVNLRLPSRRKNLTSYSEQ